MTALPIPKPERCPGRWGLHNRLSLWLAGLMVLWLLALAGLWLHDTRASIREEMRMGTQVSQQMLRSLTLTRHAQDEATVLALVQPLGRIRAHVLQVQTAQGDVRYTSPDSAYKVGRSAPAWWSALLSPSDLPTYTLPVGALRLVLTPDASRAVLDAWDDLCAASGWALLGVVLLALGARLALRQALLPLRQIMAALDRTAAGQFETRLPVFAEPELAQISLAFNGMADRLAVAVHENVALEKERDLTQCVQTQLERERTDIARELHDELAQGITAVRTLAAAVAQRCTEQPAAHTAAHSIIAVTSEMQEGVRRILKRLRQGDTPTLIAQLEHSVQTWQQQAMMQGVALDSRIDLGAEWPEARTMQCALRLVQEGLTNITRHAVEVTRVQLTLQHSGHALLVSLVDNGKNPHSHTTPLCAAPASIAPFTGCGWGLRGMRERVTALGGVLRMTQPASGGFALHATLPVSPSGLPSDAPAMPMPMPTPVPMPTLHTPQMATL